MPLFICRWQNGDFSAVSASSREEAMELLDEVGNADVADLFIAKSFMVHFQLNKEVDHLEEPVPVSFEGFGEETYDTLCERVYPVYSKASMRVHGDLQTNNDVPKEEYDAAIKVLNDALAGSECGIGILRKQSSPTIPTLRNSRSSLTCQDRWQSKR